MKTFNVPTRDQVNENNQQLFDKLENMVGFVPNLYATYAHNETALGDYLELQNRKSTLSAEEREIINLVVSEVNQCYYCLSAHTAIGKMNGFSDDQILEIRQAEINFDEKYDALATFVKSSVENRSKPSDEATHALFEVGYDEANLIDIIMVIGDKMISNFIHGTTKIPIDFPEAQPLEELIEA
ncbi:MAG: carboxymuconolactone decarboxylase family protein [Balneolaceae bacterium]|nr:carboxymuconolactone decarboxylase family protein [Balneolaceae bacterium]MBO6545369.1 carboxymuconolactone decarboxylase family protein [Balneolaceae bacterium]MBO6646765.1 carboxymuconolactone decarboxylase family protein [Balneolaceae bacterium]